MWLLNRGYSAPRRWLLAEIRVAAVVAAVIAAIEQLIHRGAKHHAADQTAGRAGDHRADARPLARSVPTVHRRRVRGRDRPRDLTRGVPVAGEEADVALAGLPYPAVHHRGPIGLVHRGVLDPEPPVDVLTGTEEPT